MMSPHIHDPLKLKKITLNFYIYDKYHDVGERGL